MFNIRTIHIVPWHGKILIETYINEQLFKYGWVVEEQLPDINDVRDKSIVNFEAGYQFQFQMIIERADLTPLFDAFLKQMNKPTEHNRRFTYETITNYSTLHRYDFGIWQWLMTMKFNAVRLKQEAIWLLNHAAHREVMKFALILFRLTPVSDLINRLYAIAHHEEFTHLAIVVLNKDRLISSEKLWELNDKLKGWGKVHLLEVIPATTDEQREKLLFIDYPQKHYSEFPALHITESLNLLKLAKQSFITRNQYIAIGIIVEALFSPSIFDDFSQYPDAVHVMEHYIRHSRVHCQTIIDFYPLIRLQQLLTDKDFEWEYLLDEGWNETKRTQLREMLQPFVYSEKWLHLSIDEITSLDTRYIHPFADLYKYDLTEWAFKQLIEDQYNIDLYRIIYLKNDIEVVKRVENFILSTIDLTIPTRKEWEVVSGFLMYLHNFDGAGFDIIKRILELPIFQLHVRALVTMINWDSPTVFNSPFIKLIQNLEEKSDHHHIKRLIRKLMKRDI